MSDITITEDKENNTILIKGCETRKQAEEEANKWLHERDCLLVELREQEDGYLGSFTCDEY